MDSWWLYLLTVPFPAALTWAMISDVRNFEIPNAIPILLASAYLVSSLALGTDLLIILRQCGIGGAALALGFVLFAFRIVGGGDVKLMAALVPWLAPAQIPSFLFWMAIAGGLIGLLLLALRHMPALPGTGIGDNWLRRISDAGKIPYGLAIGCAGLITFPNIPLLSN